jgi:hypothetical protein
MPEVFAKTDRQTTVTIKGLLFIFLFSSFFHSAARHKV